MKLSFNDVPKNILLREDGPREGFQMLAKNVSTAEKLELISALSETGIREIEVTSFVRADKIPQMADADTLAAQLIPTPGVRFTALYLNTKGLLRSLAHPALARRGCILLAASEQFLKRNNNVTLEEALAALPEWARVFKENGLACDQLIISTAFGDPYGGKIEPSVTLQVVDRAVAKLSSLGAAPLEITLADTTGFGTPESVVRLVGEVRSKHPTIEIGLHLHDTRGTGMPNVLAGLLCGVSRFDCSVGGLGGCPFAPGAAGNVPTEDVLYLCEGLGGKTGVDLEKYLKCARIAERIAGYQLPSKILRGGTLC